MRKATIRSYPSTDHGTFSEGETDSGLAFKMGELPDRNNEPGLSSIVPKEGGVFIVRDAWSDKHNAMVWHILDAPGRTAVEWHSANFMGDINLGFVSQLLGCGAPGAAIVRFKKGFVYSEHAPPLAQDQIGVSSSGPALAVLRRDLGSEFELTIIRNAFPPLDLTKI